MDSPPGRQAAQELDHPPPPPDHQDRDSPAAKPKARSCQLRNRVAQPTTPIFPDDNISQHREFKAVDIEGPDWYRGVGDAESEISGPGISVAVLPGTVTQELSETRRQHSPSHASHTSSMSGTVETRDSRSQSRVRRSSFGSIKEEITGMALPADATMRLCG